MKAHEYAHGWKEFEKEFDTKLFDFLFKWLRRALSIFRSKRFGRKFESYLPVYKVPILFRAASQIVALVFVN